MSFQQGGGWVNEEEWGWMVEGVMCGGVIAPDAHTPTTTNYHCVLQKEEVKTEAPQTQMSQFCPFLSTETEDSMVTSSSGKLFPPCLPGATASAIWCSYGPNYVR